MNKIWKVEQLEKISAQTAIFRHIPEEIGNVLYCDSNQPNSEPLSAGAAKRKKIIAISVCALILNRQAFLIFFDRLYKGL